MLTDGIFIDEYNMKETIIEEIVDKQGMYSLAGPHGIGKTYLSKRIEDEIKKEKEKYKDTVWAYVCMTQEYKHTITHIFDPFIRALDSTVRADVRKEMASKRSITESGACILDKLQKHVVLVLDEFQNIEEQPQLMESLYQWYKTKKLSILFIARPRVSVLWENIKHRDGLENKIEKNWSDGFINIGNCYMVPGFSKTAREKYLEACVANSKKNIVISEDAKKVIYYYAGGHPATLYDIMKATEQKIRQKKGGEELRANDVSIPMQAIEEGRFKKILEQMESVLIGEKNAKDLFFETFENSGLDKMTRYENAKRLYDQGYLVEVNEAETCCKLLGLDEAPEGNESMSMVSIRKTLDTYKNYITVEGYEPMSPYCLVYCGKQYKDEVRDVGDKLKRMELHLREFLFGKLIVRYGNVESILKMLVFLFPSKDFPTQSADAERQAASNGMHKLKKPLTALSFGDYLVLMKLHWKTPFFSCFSNDDCKHMFTGWTKSDVEKVNQWEELSDREREELRRVSFARARNTTAHENIGPDEVFSMKQLRQLKEDIEAIQGELDKGEGLEKPIVTGYEKYCLVGRSFLFAPSSLQPDALGNLEGVLSELTYKAYLKEEEYREKEAVTVVCWDAAKNAYRVSYQTSVNGNYRNISNIPYDSNYQNYPNFANTVEAFWFNKIDKNKQHKVNNEKVPAYAWDGFIVANVDDAAQRKYYPATINEEKVFVQGLISPMNEGSTANNRGPLSVEGVPYRVKVQKVTDNNGKVSYSVTDIVYGE